MKQRRMTIMDNRYSMVYSEEGRDLRTHHKAIYFVWQYNLITQMINIESLLKEGLGETNWE